MSLRRFNGWEPDETHIHYNADGVETGRTVVTREPEWDDEQRMIALAMESYEANICPGCGSHYQHSMDDQVGRLVEHRKIKCLDCEAIAVVQQKHHKDKGHTDAKCDCGEYSTYVGKYVPVTNPA